MAKPVTATVSKLNNAIVRGEITSYSVDAVGLYVQLKGRAHRQKIYHVRDTSDQFRAATAMNIAAYASGQAVTIEHQLTLTRPGFNNLIIAQTVGMGASPYIP
jgi:hypothetical protein